MNIGELFVKLGVDVDNASIEGFQNKVNELPGQLLNLKNVFVGLIVYGLDRFVESTIDGTVALQNFNNQTDLSIAKLQKWQVAGQLADISLTTEQVTSSVQALQKNLTEIRLGGGNIRPFQLLGIDVQGKTAYQVLEDIRSSIKGMDSATAVNLIEQTGLSPNFINVLRLTNKEFKELGDAKFLSKKQRDTLLKLGTAINKFKINMSLAKDVIVADLAPAWEALLKLVERLGNGFVRLTNFFINNKLALLALAGVAYAVVSALSPIAVLIGGLIVLFDDMMVHFEGGESALGRFWDLLNLFNPFASVENWNKSLQNVMDMFSDFWEFLKPFGTWFQYEIIMPIKEAFKNFSNFFNLTKKLEGIKSLFGFGEDEEKKEDVEVNRVFNNLKEAEKTLMQNQKTSIENVSGSNNTTSFNNSFNIQSTGNPEEVAESVIQIQQREFNYAYQDANNGAKI